MSSKKTASRKSPRQSARITAQPAITVAHVATTVAPTPLRLISLPTANKIVPVAPRQAAAPTVKHTIAAVVDPQERRTMIAKAAYSRAVRLGLGRTDPFEDWLIAEREVDALLARKAG